ncbi:MAG: site-specific integrase, partial [Thermosipho sp. (in: Bacteria)]|nr:site-specific integrase [Thermosipho sp. (in: thermotogales)]
PGRGFEPRRDKAQWISSLKEDGGISLSKEANGAWRTPSKCNNENAIKSKRGLLDDGSGGKTCTLSLDTIEKIKIEMQIQNLSEKYINTVISRMREFYDFCGGIVTQEKLLEFLETKKRTKSTKTYRDYCLIVRKYLERSNCELYKLIKLPKLEKKLNNIKIEKKDILNLLSMIDKLFDEGRIEKRKYLMLRSFILLGAETGMRAYELYRLRIKDIDINNNMIIVRNTKTKQERITFFNDDAKRELLKYIKLLKNLDVLFYQHSVEHIFKKYLRGQKITPKMLRKFFSQEWTRQGGDSIIKKVIMGHSLSDIDLNHYNYIDVDVLREHYFDMGIKIL